MNLSALNIFRPIITDLREKRLWPIVAALIAAMVAIPILLGSSGSSSSAPLSPPTGVANVTTGPAAPAGVPAVVETSAPSHARIKGRSRDPFSQQHHGKGTASSSSGSSTGSGASTPLSSTTATTPSSAPSTPSGSTTPSTATTPSTTTTPTTTTGPSATPPPGLSVLTDTESYRVAMSMTTTHGGVVALDPSRRLALLPSARNALLVELGVLRGGRRVLFAVQPGAVVHGPGTCTPGPADCRVLALRVGQIERFAASTNSGSGSGQIVSLSSNAKAPPKPAPIRFAVTSITRWRHASIGDADQARRAESAAGRVLLTRLQSTALALFRYVPSLGAIVDLRNVSIGGN